MNGRHRFIGRGVLVLLYHRIAQLNRDPWSLCVSPAHFAEQLGVLQEQTDLVRLAELSAEWGRRIFRKPRVAVTFDDGYADNLQQAAPLLRRYGIPASVFIVSAILRHGREFWWDELERIVFQPDGNSSTRVLKFPGRTLKWTLPEATVESCDPWRAWTGETPTPAHGVYRVLYEMMSVLPADERNDMMDGLIEQAGLNPAARCTHRPLSCEELRELADTPLIEIGVHTVSHPVLSKLPLSSQAREVLQAKSEVEAVTGMPARHFSYPYGKREHYDRDTIEVVRNAGFDFAYVNEPGLATASGDRFQIPRVVVPALAGPEFARWLARCLSTFA